VNSLSVIFGPFRMGRSRAMPPMPRRKLIRRAPSLCACAPRLWEPGRENAIPFAPFANRRRQTCRRSARLSRLAGARH